MRLKTDIDITQFLSQVKKCSRDIYYETTEGDLLNLSSALSQYVFCSIANKPKYWKTGTVRCKDKADYQLLSTYLVEDDE